MKVLNLRCAAEHVFEGWFASEDDFAAQKDRGLLECPMCGSQDVIKALSAPRLNLRGGVAEGRAIAPAGDDSDGVGPAMPESPEAVTTHAMWLQAVRHVMAHTEDVGPAFAEEARRIHYGEAPERGIRGRTTSREREALIEEGIEVMPLPMPKAFEGPMQ